MGYYIDQLAEQERQMTLAALLAREQELNQAGVLGGFPAFQDNRDARDLGAISTGGGLPPQGYDFGPPVIGNQYVNDHTLPSPEYRGESMAGMFPSPSSPQRQFLRDIGKPQPQPQEQLPQNFIRNESTGAVTNLDRFQQPSSQSLLRDMSKNPVDTPFGRGSYLKGDNTRVVLDDGRIVDLGRDTGAERVRTKENLALDKTRAEIAQLREKPRAETTYDKTMAEARAHFNVMNQLPPQMREAYGKKHGLYAPTAAELAETPGTVQHQRAQKFAKENEKVESAYVSQVARLDAMLEDAYKLITPEGKANSDLKSFAGPIDQLTPEWFAAASRAKSAFEPLKNKATIKNLAAAKKEAEQSFGAMAVKEWPRFENMDRLFDPSIDQDVVAQNIANFAKDVERAKAELTAARDRRLQGGSGSTGVAPTVAAGQSVENAADRGAIVTMGGKQYPVVSRNPDGSAVIKDPRTGKTGVWRP